MLIRLTIDCLTGSTTKHVVLKTRRSAARNRRQLSARIPTVRVGAVVQQVSVIVVAVRLSPTLDQLVCGIVSSCRSNWRGNCSGQTSTHLRTSAYSVVFVREVADYICAQPVGDTGDIRAGVVAVVTNYSVWQRD